MQYQQVVNTTYSKTVTTHTFTRVDPGEYEGPTDGDGKRDGFGQCKWSDGSEYSGRWKDNVRHGEGTFKSSDGSTYEGPWDNDIKVGEGKITYTEKGKVIVGTWVMDRLDGQGTIQLKGKDPVDVIFCQDIIIEQKAQLGCCDHFYVFTAVLFCLGFYGCLATGLIMMSMGRSNNDLGLIMIIVAVACYFIH